MRYILFFAVCGLASAYPSGSRIPAGNSGEPGTGTPCAACHSVTLNPANGAVNLTHSGSTFTPGVAQRWTVTITDPNSNWRRGFQLTANGGTFAAVSSTYVFSSAGKPYVTQSSAGSSFSFDWTPPSNMDSVVVYLAGAAVNGTPRTNVYTTSFTLSKAPATPAPSVGAGGVVNAASFTAGISAGSWVTIFGTNLAPAGVARSWTPADMPGGVFPTTLEGTQVKINGKPAAIAYVSPTQLNVQAPDDSATGAVPVEVTLSGVSGVAGTAALQMAAPAFFRFDPGGSRFLAAVHANGVLAGPPGLYGAGVALEPVKPGEILMLFGTGFGPTSPPVPAGQLYQGAAPLADGNGLAVRIGGVPAEVKFAGISAAGLYQLNVLVPTLPDGDQLVEATVWGQAVPAAQYLAVKN